MLQLPATVSKGVPEPTCSRARVSAVDTPSATVVSVEARRWFGLAIASLVIAGLLSLSVVLGRLPVLSWLVADPLFFKRSLVVHVDLSLLAWFYTVLCGLTALQFPRGTGWAGALASSAATIGIGAMLAGGLVRGAQPVLANYIPVIDHPLFLSGLALFFIGVVAHLATCFVLPVRERRGALLPPATMLGVQVAGVAVILAAATWIAAVAGLPAGLDAATFFEFSGWGPGHVLQVANVIAMIAVWCWAFQHATGEPLLTRRAAAVVFGGLLAPHLLMPLLTVRGTLDTLYHRGATQLMRWGIFPVVVLVLGMLAARLWKARTRPQVTFDRTGANRTSALAIRTGLAASAGLTALGFILGACIRSSTTLIPAHYHASLGGITVSFMLAAYLVADAVARGRFAHWLAARRQLMLFGSGQTIFVLGFALGGSYGLGRKAYGAEQHVRTLGEYAGLIAMGLGGLVAVAGGLWFLFLIIREMRGWWRRPRVAVAPDFVTPNP